MSDEKSSSIITAIWLIIAVLVCSAIGFIESGQLMGAAIALAIGVIAYIATFVGLIPFGGWAIYVWVLWPVITGAIGGMQPTIHIPITLTLIFVVTAIATVIYTIGTTLLL